MGLLDGILGGVVGGEMVSVVNNLIERHGGVQGNRRAVPAPGAGRHDPVLGSARARTRASRPTRCIQAFGQDTIAAMAAKIGMSPQDLANKLSATLLQAIDKLTPGGVVPPN